MTGVSDLAAMGRADLARLWSELIGGEVPASMSQPMQRRFLAFEMQARAQGGLSAALVARLQRIEKGEERKASPTAKPGARFLREWNGVTHVVDVLPDGYLWNGTKHGSLSAIARAITGARWSGPRFFGLASSGEPSAARNRSAVAKSNGTRSFRKARGT